MAGRPVSRMSLAGGARSWLMSIRTRGLMSDPGSLVLAALTFGLVLILAAMRLASAPEAPQLAAQAILILVFGALVLRDYRLAVTIAMIELATAGAAGRWTVFPGGLSGRIVLDALVVLGALRILYRAWRTSGRLDLGRYGLHAVVAAGVLVLVWVPLGLLSGYPPSDVVGDGNGYAFLAFVVVFIALLSQGQGRWVRDSLLVACAFNAIFLFAIFLLALSGIVPLYPTVRVALGTLGFDGAIGIMPSGAWRLYPATSLYIQIGLVLVGWRLLQAPRLWLWALYAVLLVDLGLTYTRGFWIGAAAALIIVLLLGAKSIRGAVTVLAGTTSIVLLVTAIGLAVGFSVPNYILDRAASSLTARPVPSGTPVAPAPTGSGQPGIAPTVPPLVDELGAIGNQIRIEQARILIGHIRERPLLGSGFGAIATDYPYGDISRYEISYLDLAFKTGLIGTVIFLSLPVRLLIDGLKGRLGRRRLARSISRREASVPIAIVASILAVSASNPYLFAAYGLMPVLVAVVWLDPMGADPATEPLGSRS